MRWLRRRLAIDATTHGADRSGSEDSLEPIRSALTAAAARASWPAWLNWLPGARWLARARRTVYLPAGTYAVGSATGMPPGTSLTGR